MSERINEEKDKRQIEKRTNGQTEEWINLN